jgi:hypothetical protein
LTGAFEYFYTINFQVLLAFTQFSKDNPKSAKIKTKARRSKKYQASCFQLKRELHKPLDEDIFSQAFDIAMK